MNKQERDDLSIESNALEKNTDESLDKNSNNKNESNILDLQWVELTQDWQSQPTEKSDIKALLKQTKRRTIKAKALFASSVIATITMLLSWCYGTFFAELDPLFNHYMGICGLMSIVFCYYEYKVRIQVWREIAQSPEQAIQNALKGHQSSLNYIKLVKWSFIPFGAVGNWFVITSALEHDVSIAIMIIAINLYLLIFYALTHWFEVKRKKEYYALLERISNI